MSVQGIFASNQGIVGERQGDFASAVLMTNPTGSAPFLAMTSGMGKEGASDTVFTWFEDSHNPGRADVVSGGTGTTVVVSDGSSYTPNTILLVEETGEHIFVSGTAGNSLTVIRGLAGTAIVSLTSSMHVQKIGNAFEEASGMPTAVTQQGAPRMNYTQIFRNGWAISGTAKAVKFLTGNKLAYNKQMCAMYHAEDMERTFLWGRKAITTLNNKQFRMTDGVLAQIEQNGGTILSAATDSGSGPVAGELSRNDLDEFIREIFAYNVKGMPNERIAFGGDIVLQAMNRMTWLDGSYEIKQGETKLGIAVNTVVTPFGSLKLMTHPLMNENPVWAREMYVLHPGGIKKRVLRETNQEGYDKNGLRIQGKDADEGVITTECGIQVGAARTMGILRNVQRGVASV
jgi:Family of unknown function (DUF5309)